MEATTDVLLEENAAERGSGERGAAARSRRVAWNSIWLIAQPLALNVLSVVTTGYIARKLGAADYGAFTLGFTQIALLHPLCVLGLDRVAMRAIAEDRDRAGELAGPIASLRLLFTLLTALAAQGWLWLSPFSLETRVIGSAAVLNMVFTFGGSGAYDVLVGFERSYLAAQAQLVGGLVLTILSVLALLCGLGLPGFVGAYVVGAALQWLLMQVAAWRSCFPVLPGWSWPLIRDLLHQMRPFTLLSLMGSVTCIAGLDLVVLGAYIGSDRVGPYAAAMSVLGRLLVVPEGITLAAYPTIASGYRERREETETFVWRCLFNIVLVTVPLALCLTFTAPTVLWILFGEQYVSAADAMRVGAWMIPLWALNLHAHRALAAVHRQGIVVWLTAATAALSVLLLVLLVPRFGLLGAAGATVAAEVLVLPPALWAMAGSFRRRGEAGDWGRLLLALGVMPLVLLPFTAGGSVVLVVLGAVLSMAAFAAAATALRLVEPAALLRMVKGGAGEEPV